MKNKKIVIFLKVILIIIFIVVVVAIGLLLANNIDMSGGKKPVFGLTFSEDYAKSLGLNWQEAYSATLNDLHPQTIRLVAYWNEIESSPNNFFWNDLDWQVKEASKKNSKIILAIGERVPRWPECHIPNWASQLSKQDFQNSLDAYLKEIVNHYKNNPDITVWQVENEPLLSVFGDCPPPDINLLKNEIAVVKASDPSRPVMMTDSGELSLWLGTDGLADILGTSFYRIVWDPHLGWVTHYFIPPVFYTIRAWIAEHIFGVKEVVISELQAEPWAPQSITSESLSQQTAHFTLQDFQNNITLAKRTGLSPIYFWGAEWWYYRKIHGDDSWWSLAEKIFNQQN
jgi:hypothetical protein